MGTTIQLFFGTAKVLRSKMMAEAERKPGINVQYILQDDWWFAYFFLFIVYTFAKIKLFGAE